MTRQLTLALTALVPIIWGSTYLVTQTWLPEGTPFTAAVMRAVPAGLLLVLIARQWLTGRWWLKALLLGALNIGVFFTCLFAAAYRLPGSVAALLLASQPIWVLLLSRIWLSTPFSRLALVQCFGGLVGLVFLLNPEQGTLDMVGVGLALLGAMSMATGVVLAKRWQRPSHISLLGLTGWQLLMGGLLMIPLMIWREGLPQGFEPSHWFGYGYLMLIGGVFSYSLWFWGIQKLPAVSVSLLGFLSPLSATVLGFYFQHETFGALQWIGAVSVVLSLFLPLLVTTIQRQRSVSFSNSH